MKTPVGVNARQSSAWLLKPNVSPEAAPPTRELSAKGRESMRKIDASWEARLGKDRMREMRSSLSEVLDLCRA
jgi:hypothetical protein